MKTIPKFYGIPLQNFFLTHFEEEKKLDVYSGQGIDPPPPPCRCIFYHLEVRTYFRVVNNGQRFKEKTIYNLLKKHLYSVNQCCCFLLILKTKCKVSSFKPETCRNYLLLIPQSIVWPVSILGVNRLKLCVCPPLFDSCAKIFI